MIVVPPTAGAQNPAYGLPNNTKTAKGGFCVILIFVKKVLNKSFFARPTPLVARELLGKFLVRQINGTRQSIALMITESEAYDGFKDRGSHAHRGQTARNQPMFGPPGHWYVYITYGLHWMLNIVTREAGYPAAVLIRGGITLSNSRELESMRKLNGPGRLTSYLEIDGELSNRAAAPATGLWIEDRGVKIRRGKVKNGKRIGIDYAGPYWAVRRWRYWLDASD